MAWESGLGSTNSGDKIVGIESSSIGNSFIQLKFYVFKDVTNSLSGVKFDVVKTLLGPSSSIVNITTAENSPRSSTAAAISSMELFGTEVSREELQSIGWRGVRF